MNKSESKYFNTSVKMCEAFLALLNKKEFEYISIKEICDMAKVNRSTFYLHYNTVGDLLDETMDYINNKFSAYFADAKIDINKINSLPLDELYLITPEYLTPWLTFVRENKKLFQTFLKRHETLRIATAYEQIFGKVISPIFSRYGVLEQDREYIFLFYVEGIIAIVKKWIREGCVRPLEDIADLIMQCVKTREN